MDVRAELLRSAPAETPQPTPPAPELKVVDAAPFPTTGAAALVPPAPVVAEPSNDQLTPDHPTPLRIKTHSHGPVPFALAGAGIAPDSSATYDELTAARSELTFEQGWKLMGYFLSEQLSCH